MGSLKLTATNINQRPLAGLNTTKLVHIFDHAAVVWYIFAAQILAKRQITLLHYKF
jgi:hypothetical protein